MISNEEIIEKLKECIDPELGINVVDLGLIYAIGIEGQKVIVTMTLTTMGCPLDNYFVKDITKRLQAIKGISEVTVNFSFEPPWTPSKMSKESRDLLGFVN